MNRADGFGSRDVCALVLLAAFAVGFLWPSTLGGRVMLPADLLLVMEPWRHYSGLFPDFRRVSNPILDAVQQFYPWRKFAGEILRRGEIPLWNPYELCGNPFVGNNQSAVFYPETWLHALMPPERALGWATALYLFCSGSLMYWFLRVLALRRLACIVGALAFMFNGFIIGWLCFPSFRSVPGWLPGMLAAFEMSTRGRRPLWMGVCGLLTGLQFLAGNLHISLYVLVAFVSWVAFRCGVRWRRDGCRPVLVSAASAGGALVVGGLVACVQLLPTLELAGMSSRAGGLAYQAVLDQAIPWQNLLGLLMPDLLGNPVDYNHWGAELGKVYRAYTESALYVGVLPVLLAPLGWRRQETRYWLALAACGALLAIGTHLNAVLYFLVPGFRSLSGIGRAVMLVATGVAIAGAIGLDTVLRSGSAARHRSVRMIALSACGLGLLGLVSGLWTWAFTGRLEASLPGIGNYTLLQVMRFLVFLGAGCGSVLALLRWPRPGAVLVVAVLAADLYLFMSKFTPHTDPAILALRPRAIETMRMPPGQSRVLGLGRDPIRRMAPNTAMIVGLEDVQGSDSLEVGTYRRMLTAGSSERLGFSQPDPALPLMDLLGVRFIHSGVPVEGAPKLRLVSDTDGYLYENPRALPRAFIASGCEAVTPQEAFRRVTAPDFDPRGTVLLDAQVPVRAATAAGVTDVTVAAYTPNAVTLTGTFHPGQVVVLADTYYPGWWAYAGAVKAPVLRANYALRAVLVPDSAAPVGSPEQIRFLYVPGTFWVGGFLSLAAAGVLAGLAGFVVGRRG